MKKEQKIQKNDIPAEKNSIKHKKIVISKEKYKNII